MKIGRHVLIFFCLVLCTGEALKDNFIIKSNEIYLENS